MYKDWGEEMRVKIIQMRIKGNINNLFLFGIVDNKNIYQIYQEILIGLP